MEVRGKDKGEITLFDHLGHGGGVFFQRDAEGFQSIRAAALGRNRPVADGPVVEEASRRALSDGVSLRGILEELIERKGLIQAGVVLMGYLNPFLQYGYEKLARDAARGGVHDFPRSAGRQVRPL